jgi:hypothetical protein
MFPAKYAMPERYNSVHAKKITSQPGEIVMESALSQAVSRFANSFQAIADDDLDRAWAWQSYDSEGIHFAFFRTYEELRELAVRLQWARAASGKLPSEAQLVLAQYHAAYHDLQAALLGVGSEHFELPPAEGEWSLKRIIAHIIGADMGFYVCVRYALNRHRADPDLPPDIPDEAWNSILDMDEDAYRSLMEGSLEDLRSYHARLHTRILADLADMSEAELEKSSRYWEQEAMSLRFRLHRFESHMRQHTIQVDKTLESFGLVPNESKCMLRMIYTALAEAEGKLIGANGAGREMIDESADRLKQRTDEIARILT